MTEPAAMSTSLRQRLRAARTIGQFAYRTLIAPWPPFMIYLICSGILGGITPLLQIYATTGLIDALTARTPRAIAPDAGVLALLAPYAPWLLLLIGTMLVNWLVFMDTIQRYFGAQLNERVKERFDALLFQKALSLRLEQFERQDYHDTLLRAYAAMGGQRVAYQLTQLIRLGSTLLGCVGILWALGAVYWFIPVLVVPASGLFVQRHMRRARELIDITYAQTTLERKRSYWQSLLLERGTAAELRLFGLAEHIVATWCELTDRLLGEQAAFHRREIRREIFGITLHNDCLFCIVALLLLVGARQGRLSAGGVVALLFALPQYSQYVAMIRWRMEQLQRFLVDLRYASTFLALAGDEPQSGNPAPAIIRDGVRFEGVSFTYPGATQPALSAVDLHIGPGERIALVGENGSGKSTLVKLLLGLYRPVQGHITVDGVDLATIAPEAWRAVVGAVMQEYMRYAFSAAENIGFGNLERLHDHEAIAYAARLSGAAPAIEQLPNGYATILGKEFPGGADLSLGQWQKLAIARAYLREASILVFDEPASALDALAELEVYRQFLSLAQGRTVLLISHRLGSARLADRIIVLRQGTIVELGTHDQLIASNGHYAELYALQAAWYRDGARYLADEAGPTVGQVAS